jgi:hypothetical protein
MTVMHKKPVTFIRSLALAAAIALSNFSVFSQTSDDFAETLARSQRYITILNNSRKSAQQDDAETLELREILSQKVLVDLETLKKSVAASGRDVARLVDGMRNDLHAAEADMRAEQKRFEQENPDLDGLEAPDFSTSQERLAEAVESKYDDRITRDALKMLDTLSHAVRHAMLADRAKLAAISRTNEAIAAAERNQQVTESLKDLRIEPVQPSTPASRKPEPVSRTPVPAPRDTRPTTPAPSVGKSLLNGILSILDALPPYIDDGKHRHGPECESEVRTRTVYPTRQRRYSSTRSSSRQYPQHKPTTTRRTCR